MRPPLPVAVVVAAVLALAGCTASPDGTANPSDDPSCVGAASGAASEAVRVTGELGAIPTIDITTPLTTDSTERSVVIAGDGEQLVPGRTALLEYTLFSTITGEQIGTTGHDGSATEQFAVDEAQTPLAVLRTIECAHVGDRIAAVIDAADAFGAEGAPGLGVAADEDVILVIDVVGIVPTRADGEEQELPAGFPVGVEFDDDGRPTISIPDEAPPAELQIELLRRGDGAVVGVGDTVTLHYQGVEWETGEIFDESWGSGPRAFQTTGVVAGFGAALEGSTVGSQVIAILPPDQAYGEASDANTHQLAGKTLVFVIDILGTTPA